MACPLAGFRAKIVEVQASQVKMTLLSREDVDAEAKRLAVRKVAAEREADVRMEALSRQMREMIRQGREALGSTVQVEEYRDGVEAWDDV